MKRYILRSPKNEFEATKQVLAREGVKILEEMGPVSGFLIEISREDLEKIKSQNPHWQFLSTPTTKVIKDINAPRREYRNDDPKLARR